MFDIHTHILPSVDDGSASTEISLALLKEEYELGATDVVLTPHYRGTYQLNREKIEQAFTDFKEQVKQNNIPVNLYLGREVYMASGTLSRIKEGRFLTLNGTRNVLIELNYFNDTDITESVYELKLSGFTAVIAHVERYPYVSLQDVVEVKAQGGYIQVNAESLFDRSYKKMVKRLFKEGLVDFVASDIHCGRKNYLLKAYKKVLKKYGEKTATAVFKSNAEKIIKGQA